MLICTGFKYCIMEIGKLNNTKWAERLHPGIKALFDFLRTTDFDRLPMGKVEVDGDDIFVMNLDIQGADVETQPLEMHRDYIDVHILLDGEETIGWKPLDDIGNITQEYDKASDCALSDDRPRMYVELKPQEFCIVFPDDPHSPAIGKGSIRKLIGKVKI